jgi:hypothetical protein
MAINTVDGLIHLGNLWPAGQKALTDTTSDSTKGPVLGTLSFMTDLWGLRVFRYSRIMTAQTPGACVDRVALKTGTITGTSPSPGVNDTTHITASGFAATAGDEVGKVAQINVSGGAAPEGESGFVAANSATVVTLDPLYPLSVAAASAGTFSVWAANHWDDGALDTNKVDVGGIVMGTPAAKDFGWLQIYGVHPAVQKAATIAATANAAGCCGVKVVIVRAAELLEDCIGYFPMATSSTAVQAVFNVDLWLRALPIALIS